MTTGRVFRRTAMPDPPVAVEAYGCTIRDADGREYLDGAGGAVVVNVGHGRRQIADVMAAHAGRLAYAHGVDGDTILLGPPFVITDAELGQVVARLGDAVEAVAAAESVA